MGERFAICDCRFAIGEIMGDDEEIFIDGEIGEQEWLSAASKNEVFEFLNDKSEDIYCLVDGRAIK